MFQKFQTEKILNISSRVGNECDRGTLWPPFRWCLPARVTFNLPEHELRASASFKYLSVWIDANYKDDYRDEGLHSSGSAVR